MVPARGREPRQDGLVSPQTGPRYELPYRADSRRPDSFKRSLWVVYPRYGIIIA